MPLSTDLLSQFAKVAAPKEKSKKETTVYGTVVESNGKTYVKIDGSEILTPITSTTNIKPDERVAVLIKNHTATVTGNITSPSAQSKEVDAVGAEVDTVGAKVTELELVIADRVTVGELEATIARIESLETEDVTINGILIAQSAVIEELEAEDIKINGYLDAQSATIEDLKTSKAEVGELVATNGKIDELVSKNVTIEQRLTAQSATIGDLEADNVTINAQLVAQYARINELDANKISATDIEGKYANIDFSNIGEAAIEKLFAESGIIKGLVVENGTISGELVGVTIKGDLIEAGTLKADRLVVRGTDGQYYKLNLNEMGPTVEVVEEDQIHGKAIIAQSITADKITVSDLVAFDATIGGFKLTETSIYSGVKSSVNNTTRGTYLDKDGQFAMGDATNYVRFYKNANGTYRLDISASTVKMGGSSTTVEDELKGLEGQIEKTVVGVDIEYYLSSSATVLSGGTWLTVAPEWVNGKYMWSRTKTSYQDGSSTTSDPTCIAGAKGDTGAQGLQGIQGEKGEQGIPGESGVSSYFHIKYSSVPNPTLSSQMSETPDKYIGTYVDYTKDDSSNPENYDWYQFQGVQGERGEQGIPGVGVDGKTSYLHIAYANNDEGTVDFSITDSTDKLYIGQYTDFDVNDKDDPKLYKWSKIKGDIGTSVDYITEEYYLSTSKETPTDGSWSETPPTWSSGMYVWTRSKIVYKDPPSTAYTEAICDSSWEAANELIPSIENAQDTADKAQGSANENAEAVKSAKLIIDSIVGQLELLVTDADGASLMSQNGDGWTFNMGEILSTLETLSTSLDELTLAMGDTNLAIDVLRGSTKSWDRTSEWVQVGSFEDEPCIFLSESDTLYRLAITNTRIMFLEGTNILTYITNTGLHTKSIEIENELRHGDFVWSVRSNGNYGISWREGS